MLLFCLCHAFSQNLVKLRFVDFIGAKKPEALDIQSFSGLLLHATGQKILHR